MLCQRVVEIAEGVAAMHRGHAECLIVNGEPAVVNDGQMVQRFQEIVEQTIGSEAFTSEKQEEGSDDFGFYSNRVPSIYFWFGSHEPGNESYVHTPTFAASDDLLLPTTELTIRYCLDYLTSSA